MTILSRPPPTTSDLFCVAVAYCFGALPEQGSQSHREIPIGLLLAGVILSGLIVLTACGGGNSLPGGSAISVSASPANVTVVSGKTRQFTAIVSNSSNTTVTWSATAGTIDPAGLFTAPAVDSTTQINVTATSRADSGKSATVALTVNPAASVPLLTVNPASLRFAGQVGGSGPAAATVSITNGGAGTLDFTGASDQPWLVLSAGTGTAPSTLQVSPSISGLNAGTYVGHVTLTGGGSTKALTVTLTMTIAPVQHSVSLSWKVSTNPQIVSYSMYRSTIQGGAYGLLASALGGAIYRDQSVQSGTIYYYVVTAVDDTGQESTYSNEIRASIP
jgi:hypothetical protein